MSVTVHQPFTVRRLARKPPTMARADHPRWQLAATALCVIGCFYTGVFAFANARGVPVGSSLLMLAELGVLGGAGLLLAYAGLDREDAMPIAFGWLALVTGIALSIVNDRFFLDGARNFLIIAVFSMVGTRTRMATVDRCFAVLSAVVLAGLVLELVSTPAYVTVFQPAAYMSSARGVEEFSLDSSGLFRNALGYQGRWSLNLSSHRTASVFIEQVSLANFASVIGIYLVSRWRELGRRARALQLATIVLILLTNSSRTSSALAIVTLAGFWLYPLLPRYGNVVLLPFLLLIGAAIAFMKPDAAGDNLGGRIVHTMTALGDTDLLALFGGEVDQVSLFMDSGYPYVIYSATIFGLLAFWVYASVYLPQHTPNQRRAAWSSSLYLFANMLIGGTAIFSMKVSAPLWLLLGALARTAPRKPLDPR